MMDKKTAEEKVAPYLRSDRSYLVAEVGRVGAHCGTIEVKGQQFTLSVTPSTSKSIRLGEAAGYLSVAPDGPDFWKVELTDKAKADGAAIGVLDENVKNGCDYKMVELLIATPALVRVVNVSADKNAPEVEYDWKWAPTDLGRALREDGKGYVLLSPEEREQMEKYSIYGGHMPLPFPPDNVVQRGVMKFKRYSDGWRKQSSQT
jgi:hypothetical protein